MKAAVFAALLLSMPVNAQVLWPDPPPLQIRPRVLLPPAEFDHEYIGTTTIIRMPMVNLQSACRAAVVSACAKVVDDKTCNVFILDDDDLTWFGWADQYDFILRHEIGHCNGWPQSHPKD